MRIEVLLKNMTPYHSSQPGIARVNLEGKFIEGQNGFPCIRTRRIPIIGRSMDDDGVAKPRMVPIMPANSLRHELRDAMLQEIFDGFRGQHSLTIGAYAAARSGNASGNPEGVQATFAEMSAISQHPFLGLFGGGPRMIEGRLSVDMALPITPETLPLLGDGYEEAVCSSWLTNVEFKRRVDPINSITDENLELIQDATSSVTDWINDTISGQTGDETGERGLRAFNAHEVVIPGVSWLWRISVRKPTDAQRGLILNGLAALDGAHFGGMKGLSYGRVAIHSILVDGEEVWANGGLAETDTVQTWCEAWAVASDGVQPEDFENFVSVSQAAEKKASKKAAKK